MRYSALFIASLGLADVHGAALQPRQATTSVASNDSPTTSTGASFAAATAGLVETTIGGKATFLQVAAPTGDATETAAAISKATGTSTTVAALPGETGEGSLSLLKCNRPTGSPICLPSNETIVHVGDTYYVTWDPARFAQNTTITILLNYADDSSNGNRVAWTSAGTPRERGFVTISMLDSWRRGERNTTLEVGLVSYTPVSEHTARPLEGPTVYLSTSSSVYPPPPRTGMPDKLSLLIGVPVGVGALLFVLLGLYFGMRRQRKIGMGSVMGRKKGYGTRKSKRERLGLTKGAIRLEEREIAEPTSGHHPDAITRRTTEESLGSLVSEDGNAFRREMEKQRTGRA